jgi:TatD DNase family protein
MIGIGGVVTFKNSGLDKVVKDIPLDAIVLETDAPYLAPVPHRGKRNESSYIHLIAEKLATLYECSIEEIGQQTSGNALKVFGS